MSEASVISFSGDGEDQDTSFPFYRLDTGRRKYQQRRLKPQTESLERDGAALSGGGIGGSNSGSARPSGRRKKKFVGVRQRSSGRWVAEIKDTTQKIRLWLGTFDTAEDAARAYDEAACMLRGVNTRTNFLPALPASAASVLPSKAARALHQRLKSAKVKSSTTNSCTVTVAANKGDQKEDHYNFNQLGQYFEEHGSGIQAQPLHVQSFTSLLSSDKFYQRSLSGLFAGKTTMTNQEDDSLVTFDGFGVASMECQEQEVLPASTFLELDQNHRSNNKSSYQSPANSGDDLSSDTISGLEDLVGTGGDASGGGADSIYTSLFDLPVDMSMPGSSQFEELSAIYTAVPDSNDGALPENEENMILREQIRRLNFERISSASLYAMNGIQELCHMRSGETTNKSYPLLSSPTLFGTPSTSSSVSSSTFPSCKMQRSPGWGRASPAAGSENAEGSWIAHLCRVA